MTGLAHKDDYFETPPFIVTNIENETGLKFDIDISASLYNSKCNLFISESTNALKVDWIPYYCNQKVPNAYENISKSEGVLTVFCNPPRSKNGKFVIRALEEWKKLDINIVMLLCWNDLGNKYCNAFMLE